ncbi:hypothetical protein SAMN02799624_04968 [Paenibacillus sp. UNC496MF]|uniref:hypothetical protein n=1 Tax=Paenibacillus sp. UNC496MF TaxID=1502753 RepID=UPI0008E5EC4C|nr:hypothetical protein [Paenibacillus sp. UNC496MF]SFJ55040.1 hypothetical protein SAMN02799624_04968 [Paenibacillus sp. UNC496MF]
MNRVDIDNKGIPPLAGICTYDEACKPGFTVDRSVELLKRFNYISKSLNQMLSAHLARVPEWEVKCAFGYHLWLDAEHSAAIRKRVSEMREPPLGLDQVPDDKLRIGLDEAIRGDDTIELLVGFYRVIRTEMIKALNRYLDEMNRIAEHPTYRLLRGILQDQEEMAAWGEQALTALIDLPEKEKLATHWENHLQTLLKAAGGIFGDVTPEPCTGTLRSDGQKYEMDPVPRRDERFTDPYNTSAKIDSYFWDESCSPEERAYSLIYKRLREMDVPEWMGPILYKIEGKPWEYYTDLSRQLWDETRHAMLGEIGLYFGGVPFYKYPIPIGSSMILNTELTPTEAHLVLWRIEQSLMPKQTGKQKEWEIAKETGNPISLLIQDYDWADEVLHAQIGRKWLIPDYGSLTATTEIADQAMKAWGQASGKAAEWSEHKEWWPQFMDEIRENEKRLASGNRS